MHLIYVDDSYEKPFQIYSAIAIPAESWRVCFSRIQEWRRALKLTDGILITKEFHATDFVAGRGRLGPQVVGKYRRSQISVKRWCCSTGCLRSRFSMYAAVATRNGRLSD